MIISARTVFKDFYQSGKGDNADNVMPRGVTDPELSAPGDGRVDLAAVAPAACLVGIISCACADYDARLQNATDSSDV